MSNLVWTILKDFSAGPPSEQKMSSNQFTGSESRSLNLAWRKSFQNQSGHRQTCIRCSLACMCAVMANLGSGVVVFVIERRTDIFDRDTRPLLSTGFKESFLPYSQVI